MLYNIRVRLSLFKVGEDLRSLAFIAMPGKLFHPRMVKNYKGEASLRWLSIRAEKDETRVSWVSTQCIDLRVYDDSLR